MNSEYMIPTVMGNIPSNELGICQVHEHVMLRRGVPAQINPVLCMDNEEKSRKELVDFRWAGGNALVDAQPVGCGRMPAELSRISRSTGVHIVASTGFYLQKFYPDEHWIHTCSEAKLEDLFCQELTDSMYQNADRVLGGDKIGQRAGIIKTALEGGGLTTCQKKLFAAAARAALICDAPIMIHIEKDSDPLELFTFLVAQGVPPNRLIFCHLDRAIPEETVVHQLCREGAYVEHDTIGRFKYHSDEKEIRLILNLLEAGHQERLLLSLDTTNQRMLSYGGSIGLTYLLNKFWPALRYSGVSEAVERMIMVANPARVLGRKICG